MNSPDSSFIVHRSSFDARLYKTGDLARYRPDGMIEFLGRIDHQIKIRGFRIEPGEIEAALVAHANVREAVVVVREDVPGAQRLVAYIVPTEETGDRGQGTGVSGLSEGDEGRTTNDERSATEDRRLKIEDSDVAPSAPLSSILYSLSSELRAFLAARLPAYMLPSAFVLLDALPLNPNGKIDRRALPDPDGARPAPQATYVAPQTDLELRIAAIWQALLGIDRVGMHDNFFDLGGHSLLLIQMQSQLRETLDLELPLAELFQYPTIKALAQHIVEARVDSPALQQAQQRAGTRLDTMARQRQFRQQSRAAKKPSR